jgi:hypothetical protein
MNEEEALASAALLGTRWPIPVTWMKNDGAFSGPEGILNLDSYEGELIDPNRCTSAAEQRPGDWTLAHTVNGVSAYGRLTEGGISLAQWVVRSDAPPGEDWLFPEVQATYVFAPSAGDLAGRIAAELDARHPVD